ncbi:MAG: hypothetical protein JXR77_11480, partial [Lentisphaeria bacterium]|nr:hypothetical protein [Lentisphaeria bacterium]
VRTVRLPDANPVPYTYDANGNMLGDGRRTLTWNNESRDLPYPAGRDRRCEPCECRSDRTGAATPRLVAIESTAVVPAADRRRIEFAYDGQGRRRWRKTYAWDEQAQDWALAETATFVYDGWNLIRETTTDHTQAPAVTSVCGYVWGLDLSQTLQGAGGVGGLLSCSSASSSVTVKSNRPLREVCI